ncbi:CPBP family intramembrane metalloprotease [bacterium]|nr:CPBP family intramembrane metalloprotease [bacterium]
MKQRRFLKNQTIWAKLTDYLFGLIGYYLLTALLLLILTMIFTAFGHHIYEKNIFEELVYFISPPIILLVFFKRPYDKKYFILPVKDIISATFMGFILVVLAYLFILFFQKIHMKFGKIDWFMVIYYTLMLFNAALLEELLVRGILLEIFLQKNLKWIGILFSSFIWSIFHIGNNGFDLLSFLNILLIGILFSFIYIRRKNLTFVVFLHFAWNLTLGIILGSNVSGLEFLPKIITVTIPNTNNILITGGKFGIEASIVTTFIFLVIDLYLIVKSKTESKTGSSDNI